MTERVIVPDIYLELSPEVVHVPTDDLGSAEAFQAYVDAARRDVPVNPLARQLHYKRHYGDIGGVVLPVEVRSVAERLEAELPHTGTEA